MGVAATLNRTTKSRKVKTKNLLMEITRVTRKSTAIKEVRLSPKGKYGGGFGTSSLEISKQISYVLEELNELFQENCSEFLTAGDLVF